MEGKLIVIYGINNIGKSTQAKKLYQSLLDKGYPAEFIKYPVYHLKPFGPMINDYLRNNNPHNLSPRAFQLIHLLNKFHYQEELKKKLASGAIIIAEDYRATSISWGVGAGVNEEFLTSTNTVLLDEDIVFLLDGERFLDGIEKGHTHEENHALFSGVRSTLLKLASEKNWIMVNANRDIEEIHQEMLSKVEELLNR